MKIKICMLSILFIILCGLSHPAYAFIKTQGHDFVDSSGTKVFFRGIGLGGWLVPEGYMLHIPGYGSPTSIKNMIIDLIGEENTQEFYQRYEQSYVNETDIKRIAELGYNSVRLPFNYRMLSPEDQPGVYLEEGFQVIDSLIHWCKKYDLYVILDMHCAPGGQNPDNISDSDGEARLWTESANKQRTIDIWKKIAERYTDEEAVAGYDLLNEPVLPGGCDASNLRTLFMDITRAIREVDTNHVIFIEGNIYATDFTKLTPPWDANMSYSFHKYWSETNQSTIEYMLNIRQTWGVPLWMGESGENSNPWFHETIQMLEANNVSWCWWTHKKLETTTSHYSAQIGEDYQKILDYWNNTAPRPSEAFAKTALFGMTDSLALENCRYLPGVTAAIFDTDFGTIAKPFKEHQIPGVIACVDYDLGNVNISYSDTDYKKVRWDEYQPWNTGGKYRNDGVDIELSNDEEGSLYSIGWIAAGEWLSYTVNVAQTDTYHIKFRVASLDGGGALQLMLNEQILAGPLNVPKTGGWYNWESLLIENVYIPQGKHILKLKFINSGFNINQIEFDSSTTEIKEKDDTKIPLQFRLGRNYPNPFNNNTSIPFYINQQSWVNVSIYDVQGRFINKLSEDIFPEGNHRVVWDSRTLDNNLAGSGIYFYQVKINDVHKIGRMLLIQ